MSFVLINILASFLLSVSAQIPSLASDSIGQSPPTASYPFGTITAQGNVVGALDCSANSIVSIVAAISVPNVVAVCACVEIANQPAYSEPCSACPANAYAVCGGMTPVCSCQCQSGFIQNADQSCSLAASANSRRAKKSNVAIAPSFQCDNGESVCSTPSGFECIDTTNSLDSCGGCPGNGGVNCLALSGALGVECIDSKCKVHSCFPGFVFSKSSGSAGKCTRAQ